MSELTERGKALLEGVTEGPWGIIGGNEYLTGVGIMVGSPEGIRFADAEFIAASRQLVPELIAEVERLERRTIPETVTRIDVIAPTRKENWADYWSMLIQDEGRTLILCQEGAGESAQATRQAELGAALSTAIRAALSVEESGK
ncbi:hypothetical protein BKG71_19350 [Mycobacteroides chelonae]|uniref:hypothetical protein n=1 Tax=Mycobacteroides chelonae TaxID=1774 RepID=UPI0008A9F973|nr:hypothetical protein [Mycobacteroides chelonae]OHT98276.1 hypothetical protein BKG71_19350 [Mycobacteroides chelonae]